MNLTISPINKTNNNSKPAFKGTLVPNKYLENCIEYTLKNNDAIKSKDLLTSLTAIINDGTNKTYEFDAILKNSAKGLKYIQNIKIDNIKQLSKQALSFDSQVFTPKRMAEDCIASINKVILKDTNLAEKKTSSGLNIEKSIEEIKSSDNPKQNIVKEELTKIFKELFKK